MYDPPFLLSLRARAQKKKKKASGIISFFAFLARVHSDLALSPSLCRSERQLVWKCEALMSPKKKAPKTGEVRACIAAHDLHTSSLVLFVQPIASKQPHQQCSQASLLHCTSTSVARFLWTKHKRETVQPSSSEKNPPRRRKAKQNSNSYSNDIFVSNAPQCIFFFTACTCKTTGLSSLPLSCQRSRCVGRRERVLVGWRGEDAGLEQGSIVQQPYLAIANTTLKKSSNSLISTFSVQFFHVRLRKETTDDEIMTMMMIW